MTLLQEINTPDSNDSDNVAVAAALATGHLVYVRFPRRDDRGHRTARHLPSQLDSRVVRRTVDWSRQSVTMILAPTRTQRIKSNLDPDLPLWPSTTKLAPRAAAGVHGWKVIIGSISVATRHSLGLG
jgi:hypothetical protein